MSGGYWRCSEPRSSGICGKKAGFCVVTEDGRFPFCGEHIKKYEGMVIISLNGRQVKEACNVAIPM